jgi:hypothetical protein
MKIIIKIYKKELTRDAGIIILKSIEETLKKHKIIVKEMRFEK